jgi:hypothetical protein
MIPAQFFFDYFEGLREAHGRFVYVESKREGIKREAEYKHLWKELTLSDIQEHLSGIRGVQVTPINKDSVCRFGCIDTDDYAITEDFIKTLLLNIKAKKLPLIPCRTKSGGLHIYMFLTNFIPAERMMKKLKNLAVLLSLGDVEVFPKQKEILLSNYDVGNKISLPYFGGDTGFEKAYDLKPDGKLTTLTVDEFMSAVEAVACSTIEFDKIVDKLPEVIEDGPPCLNMLCHRGVSEHRNDFMMNVCVYLKKRFPEEWEEKAKEYDRLYCKPSLGDSEVENVVRSIKRKNYGYTCSRHPIKPFCNSSVCRRRKYGVGSGEGLPVNAKLTKLKTDPALYFLDMGDGSRICCTIEELQSQRLFQRVCMEKHSIVFKSMKISEWEDILANLFIDIEEIDAPRSADPKYRLLDMLYEYLNNPVVRVDMRELNKGFVVKRDGKWYFLLRFFLRWLDTKHFTLMKENKIVSTLKDLGVSEKQISVGREVIHASYLDVPVQFLEEEVTAREEILDNIEREINGKNPF